MTAIPESPTSPTSPAPAVAPFIAHDKIGEELRLQLVCTLCDDAPTMVAFFRWPTLELAYLNRSARHCFIPTQSTALDNVTLLDFVSLKFFKQLQREVIPTIHAEAKWEGTCELRDTSGGEHTVRANLTTPLLGGATSKTWLCLEAQHLGQTRSRGDTGFSDRELLLALLEGSRDHIYFKDRASRFLRISRAQAEHFGLSRPEEAIGKTDFDFFATQHANPAFQAEQKIIRTQRPLLNLVEKEKHEDGHVTWVSTSKFPLFDRDGQVIGTFGISRDITAQKHAEEARRELEVQLQLAQRRDASSNLFCGIVKEISHPTQTILDQTHFLKGAFARIIAALNHYRAIAPADATPPMRLADLEELLGDVPAALEKSISNLERVNQIIGSAREFSQPASDGFSPVDLNHAIHVVLAVSGQEWKYAATVTTDLAPGLPQVPAQPHALNQALLCLLINACEAISENQKARGVHGEKGRIIFRTAVEAEGVTLEVSDTGCGIPPEASDHIFEPGFTTKNAKLHAGHGLALVRNVVTQHQGRIEFHTKLGQGTHFKLWLPLARAA